METLDGILVNKDYGTGEEAKGIVPAHWQFIVPRRGKSFQEE
jgi:hypothetical protein